MEDVQIKINTHTVFKRQDAQVFLTEAEWDILNILLGKIDRCRSRAGKHNNQYYVCNVDEPYAENVLNEILAGEREKLRLKHELESM